MTPLTFDDEIREAAKKEYPPRNDFTSMGYVGFIKGADHAKSLCDKRAEEKLAVAWDATFKDTIIPKSTWDEQKAREAHIEMPNYFKLFITEWRKGETK